MRNNFLLILCLIITNTYSQEKFSDITGSYLGQDPPGLIPIIFAPDIISTGNHERSLVFSPDGNELFFQKRGREYTTFIVQMIKENKKWSNPKMASFSGYAEESDDCPFYSYDGAKLFFTSYKHVPGATNKPEFSNIWSLTKTKNGWEKLEYLEIINSEKYDDYPSVTKDGTIYFNSNRDGNYDLYVSRFENGKYTIPQNLGKPINSDHYEGHPFIAADESYLILSSDRPDQLGQADLYISFRKIDETWTNPINMGNKINSKYHEVAPYVSPDGKYFFFLSTRFNPVELYPETKYSYDELSNMLNSSGNGSGDIYWVDAKIIQDLKPDYLK